MLKPEQLKSHRFMSAGRGTYEADDVDAFFNEVAESYEKMFRENGELVKKISLLAERVSQYKKDEDNIRRALLTAERMADKIQREAQQTAQEQLDSAERKSQEIISSAQNRADVLETAASVKASQLTDESNRNATERITSAERTASAMISNAEAKANDIIENAKRNAQAELDRINNEIRVNSVALDKLSTEVTTFKNSLIESYRKHIDMITSLPEKQDMPASETINTELYAAAPEQPAAEEKEASAEEKAAEEEETAVTDEAPSEEPAAEADESVAPDEEPLEPAEDGEGENIDEVAEAAEFSEETAAPDEIVENDILTMARSSSEAESVEVQPVEEIQTSDAYNPIQANQIEETPFRNGFVIDLNEIESHIAESSNEEDGIDNADTYEGDSQDDPPHSRFRGFFKK
ncbi:MAG: DivIVA domain-containing protein [Acutalibacteraceae bacterium]